MTRNFTQQFVMMANKLTTGIGLVMSVEDFIHLLFTLSSQNSANFTIKVKGSQSDVCPDFAAAQTKTNEWDTIQIKDLQDGSSINGDTGVAFAGTDDVRLFEINTNGLHWICLDITAISAGGVHAKMKGYTNL